MNHQSVIKEWLRDSVVAFSLIVAGIFVSRALAGWFPVRGSIGNLFCFVIAEIPFVCFLGMRRGFFRWWEYLGFVVCILSMVVARDRAMQLGAASMVVAGVAPGIIFGCFLHLHQAVRSQLVAPASNDGARSD
jgi:hypothetical protein